MLAGKLEEALGLGPDQVLFELLERAEVEGRLAKLVMSLEAFVSSTYPQLRSTAAAGVEPGVTYWPSVHQAAEVVYAARQLGVVDAGAKPPSYRGKFNPMLLGKILDEIANESPFSKLRRAAREARAQMGEGGRNRPLVLAASRETNADRLGALVSAGG